MTTTAKLCSRGLFTTVFGHVASDQYDYDTCGQSAYDADSRTWSRCGRPADAPQPCETGCCQTPRCSEHGGAR